ncbi:UGMP family protein, partial [Candidatus Woesearchaeota archaeon CG11_big_fil_rev_8_21_14_0_20_57_5]
MKQPICIGIESTAHTFGVGIVRGKSILANARDAYTTEQGGINPSDARAHHEAVKQTVLDKALEQAGIRLQDATLIAFSQGPGLPPCLVVGLEFARHLGRTLRLPVVGVNHCVAHLEIARLATPAKDPVLLYASGANTQVIAYEGNTYRVFGETLDQGIGNFLDQFARHLGLGFPGGPKIEALAAQGSTYIPLPYAVKGMDVSFSGMLTNLKQKSVRKDGQGRYVNAKGDRYAVENLCYSLQETAFAMLIEVAERAMAHCRKKELALGGGVACNSRLQAMAASMCQE